jgi:antitoxin component of MazEF toxin-antitoxin module
MKSKEIKVARIGNSRGVRLPAASLRRYRIGDSVIMEEMTEGILLRPAGPPVEKLSWEETAREMAASREDWSEWEATVADGLDEIPWESGPAHRVAERKSKYAVKLRPDSRSCGKK